MNTLKIDPDTTPTQFISLHDSRITSIRYSKNSVTFGFDEGFDLIEDSEVRHTGPGAVSFEDCSFDDFFCYKIRCKPNKNGLKIRGKEIYIEELDYRFFSINKYIEVFTELYSENHMLWKAEIYPHSKFKFSKSSYQIVFETMGRFPMIYTWRENS